MLPYAAMRANPRCASPRGPYRQCMTAETLTHIHRDADGTAWIDDTGVKVLQVAQEHIGHGWSADTIYENHPGLTLAQIHAALAWFYDHQEDMEKEIVARHAGARLLLAGMGDGPAQRRFSLIKAAAQ